MQGNKITSLSQNIDIKKKKKKKGGGETKGILLSEDSIPVSSYSLQGLQHNDTVSSDNLQEQDHKRQVNPVIKHFLFIQKGVVQD